MCDENPFGNALPRESGAEYTARMDAEEITNLTAENEKLHEQLTKTQRQRDQFGKLAEAETSLRLATERCLNECTEQRGEVRLDLAEARKYQGSAEAELDQARRERDEYRARCDSLLVEREIRRDREKALVLDYGDGRDTATIALNLPTTAARMVADAWNENPNPRLFASAFDMLPFLEAATDEPCDYFDNKTGTDCGGRGQADPCGPCTARALLTVINHGPAEKSPTDPEGSQ